MPSDFFYVVGGLQGTVRKLSTADGSDTGGWSANHGLTLNGVAVDSDGSVYVCGQSISGINVRKYDSDGNEVWSSGPGGIPRPYFSVAVDQWGNVFCGGNRVGNETTHKYDPDGERIWGVDDADNIFAVAVDREGNVYAGGRQQRLRKYTPDGELIWTVLHGGQIDHVAVDLQGNVYAAGQRTNSGYNVVKYDSDGEFVWGADLASSGSGYVAVSKEYVYALGAPLATDPRVHKYTLDGDHVWTGFAFTSQNGIAVDLDDNIYVVSFLNFVAKLTTDADLVWQVPDNTVSRTPAVDPGLIGAGFWSTPAKDDLDASIRVGRRQDDHLVSRMQVHVPGDELPSTIDVRASVTNRMQTMYTPIRRVPANLPATMGVVYGKSVQGHIVVTAVNRMLFVWEVVPPPLIVAPLPVTDDVFVWQAKPTLNFAGTADLFVGRDEHNAVSRTLIRFDLSSYNPMWRIDSVKMRVRVKTGPPGSYAVHKVLEPWTEDNVTWVGQPDFDPVPIAVVHHDGSEGWLEVDLRDLFDAWVSGGEPNYGIVIRVADEHALSTKRSFFASDYPGTDRDPVLQVTYVNPQAFPFLGRTQVDGTITVEQMDDADLHAVINVMYGDKEQIDGAVQVYERDSLDGILQVPNRSQLTATMAVDWGPHWLRSVLRVAKGQLPSGLMVTHFDSVTGTGTVRQSGQGDLTAFLGVNREIVPSVILVTHRRIPGRVAVTRRQLPSTITARQIGELTATLSVQERDRSDVTGMVGVSRPDAPATIRLRLYADLDGTITIRRTAQTNLAGAVGVARPDSPGTLMVTVYDELDAMATVRVGANSDLAAVVRVPAPDDADLLSIMGIVRGPNDMPAIIEVNSGYIRAVLHIPVYGPIPGTLVVRQRDVSELTGILNVHTPAALLEARLEVRRPEALRASLRVRSPYLRASIMVSIGHALPATVDVVGVRSADLPSVVWVGPAAADLPARARLRSVSQLSARLAVARESKRLRAAMAVSRPGTPGTVTVRQQGHADLYYRIVVRQISELVSVLVVQRADDADLSGHVAITVPSLPSVIRVSIPDVESEIIVRVAADADLDSSITVTAPDRPGTIRVTRDALPATLTVPFTPGASQIEGRLEVFNWDQSTDSWYFKVPPPYRRF